MSDSFLGCGFSLDFGPDSRGGLALSSGKKSVEESIRIILGTTKGERLMRPDFGCDLNSLVFAPNNSRTPLVGPVLRGGGAHKVGAPHHP